METTHYESVGREFESLRAHHYSLQIDRTIYQIDRTIYANVSKRNAPSDVSTYQKKYHSWKSNS